MTIKQHILHLQLDADNSYTAGQLTFLPSQEPLYIGGIPGNSSPYFSAFSMMLPASSHVFLLSWQRWWSNLWIISKAYPTLSGWQRWRKQLAAMNTFQGSPCHITAAAACPKPVIYKPLLRECINLKSAKNQERGWRAHLSSWVLNFHWWIIRCYWPIMGHQVGWNGIQFKAGILPRENLFSLHCFTSLPMVW